MEVNSKMSFCNKSALDYVEAAKRHKDTTKIFFEKAISLLQNNPYEITSGCSELGSLVKKRGNAVISESYKLSAYVRLTPLSEMILFGSCLPEHNTGSMIAEYITKRYHNFLILIFTDKDFHLATERVDISELPTFSGKTNEEIIEKIRNFAVSIFDDRLDEKYLLLNADDLWEVFYETQFLSQRENLKLYHRAIPKYMFNKAGMSIEEEFFKKVTNKNKQNTTLDKYIE